MLKISCPDVGKKSYEQFNFPCGETHVKFTAPVRYKNEDIVIQFAYNGDQSLIELCLLTNALRGTGAKAIELECFYFPGARQDRVCCFGEPLSVKVYAEIINSQKYSKVYIFDPHSNVAPALIDNVCIVDNTPFVDAAIQDFKPDFLVSPDAGAESRTFKAAQRNKIPWISASKKRDLYTGKIIEYKVHIWDERPSFLDHKKVLIVDDIVSYGGTFKMLGKKLLTYSVESIGLCVSHHEGVANDQELSQSGIKKIYTTNSLNKVSVSNFTNIYYI
jgi:ribose-phosphate pyrophosphokinase